MVQAIRNYIDFLARSGEDNISELKEYCTEDIHFRDPFNDVHQVAHFVAIMEESYETLSDVSFEIIEEFWSENAAVIKWHFYFRMKPDAERETITGLSEIRSDGEKVSAHLDYWDSGERIYARIPVLGFFVRQVRKRVSAGLDAN
ncbi:nuclear transport factor 2 family protein [Parvularcula sp. IMCC14364]|uniref:nuclear transport factor 2 family protein n=1 Tax=Parvularcula sp. IMCC14364 TaxID=3067902 RepID=UPI0027412488|nr:nuclear transport factor 2 family protein [Parvularcula sp. IMCC14364]